jgi:nucleoside-diphosphate-sugar epimerase
MMRVAIAGGTGLVGRYAKEALCRAGHETVTLARATAGEQCSPPPPGAGKTS